MLIRLLVLILLAALYGGTGLNTFGGYGWSPMGVLVVILVVLLLMGRLR